ncbi:lysosomal alpha-mannosidase-like [Daphnia carinata]|uniref:lysosomal alpha-mannosidase-like n=1 Tax=Daphnia carinata TaxID=120202 RepID=UPI00257D9842|nr:lysosomal alpha-mannosidase-like [Daphnia carinata]
MGTNTVLKLVCFIFMVEIIHQSSARPSIRADNCGYQTCPLEKEGFINVHLVAHTHDDAGWLKTVDQYYYGARNQIQEAGVQYIIDSVVDELKDHPDRRFIYVEMAFFSRWWEEQNDATKNIVRDLVNQGRLEFINGGWCMNDEATAYYVDIIDQMSLGLIALNDTFGECGRPRIAWQIDPFGHSREQANLFAEMGYDGLFFGRLDHEDKKERTSKRTMEMIWKASNSLVNQSSLFTAVNYNLYQPPPGFCFDIYCNDEPIIDDPKSKDYNVEKRVTDFLNYCQQQANAYATDSILLTMGSDFHYQDANVWFKNMDKLIKYANARQTEGSRFNLFYSTPSCYTKALNDHAITWPTKTDDFFPYGSDSHAYWTGYFTSRPASKYMIRQASNLLQSCKQMDATLARQGATNAGDIFTMKDAMGIMQHHDAVTGTEKQHVAEDYALLLHKGVEECRKTQTSYFEKELVRGDTPLPKMSFCQLNISQCEPSETNNQFVINVYNSMSLVVDRYVRVPLPSGINFEVRDTLGNTMPSQMIPIAESIKALPGRVSTATRELVFLARYLPPLGSKSYFVLPVGSGDAETREQDNKFSISNEKVSVEIDDVTGLIKSVTVNGKTTPLKQEFLWYASKSGDNSQAEKRASGAYIFRPEGNDPSAIPSIGVKTTTYLGELVQEIHQVYNPWVSQTIRVYKGQEHVELDWVVGPIPVEDGIGKEIISRISTDIASKATFYTDANGRQTLQRVRDVRESYPYTVTEPTAANYYPVNSHIFLKDSVGNQMTVLVDRPQGGSSLHDGELELMVHRRCLYDDAFGVGEALNETAYGTGLVVRGTHYLILGDGTNSMKLTRSLSHELYKQPQISFIPSTLSFLEWSALYRTEQQSISRTLPNNVNLLTLETLAGGKYLIRLEHIYDVGEDPILSQSVTVSLEGLFPGFTIVSAEETMLGGNQFKKDSNRLIWNAASTGSKADQQMGEERIAAVLLRPMEIRSYILTLVRNS